MIDIILNSLIEAIRQKDYQDAEHYAYRFYEKYVTISDLLDEAIEERDYFREQVFKAIAGRHAEKITSLRRR